MDFSWFNCRKQRRINRLLRTLKREKEIVAGLISRKKRNWTLIETWNKRAKATAKAIRRIQKL